jgi:PAS domain S-box-containing protein
MLGYTDEEVLGMHFGQFLALEEQERGIDYYRRTASGEHAPTDFEVRLLHQDQKTHIIGELKIELIKGEEGTYQIGTFTNLTERVAMENALRVTQFSVDRAVDAIMWADRDAQIVYVNDAICQMFGYSPEEFLQLNIHDTHPDYSQVQYWRTHWEELQAFKTMTFETDNKRKNGEVFPVEITVNYLEFD